MQNENAKLQEENFINPSEIQYKSIETLEYLVNNKLIVNSNEGNLLNELKNCLKECIGFYFSVAFINFSGLQLLLDSFKDLEERNIKGRIITSTYLNFTEPKALERIKKFNNIHLKIFVATKELGFHTKAYVFEMEEEYKIIIGSSNITQRALKSNIEWNIRAVSKKDNNFTKEILEEYLSLWEKTSEVDENFLIKYAEFIKRIKEANKNNKLEFKDYEIIKPNKMQERALESLNRLRNNGEKRSIVIAATGTGKTYMAAFDVLNCNPQKMLFIVHREDILRDAMKTFRKLAKNRDKTMGFFTGNKKDLEADYLFSTIQSMNISLEEFDENQFEYIVIDEAHHSSSPSYQRVINYFKPKFLLGMTATPERSDSDNIYDIYDNNVALELRLREALELNIVIPFHYFGITDIESIDLSSVDINNISEISRKLRVNERVDFIINKMEFYGHDGDKRKCIGFCANIEHAKYMANQFNVRGISSVYLTGNDTVDERQAVINKLQSDEDDLEVVFTVDIFNEGVDIPAVNLILMLRPTDSPIVFIQQLGRGLRKHESKNFLTVLDFIGNHKKTFLIAIALNGARYYDKDSLKVAVAKEFENIPGCTNIQMDRISQERILEQLNSENFNSMKYLKDEELKNMLLDVEFVKILKEFSSKLPIKRIYEFCIIKYLISNDLISLDEARKQILKYVDYVDDLSIKHAFQCLNQDYYDSMQIKNYIKCFELNENILRGTLNFKKILKNQNCKGYIEDVINYGILRYERDMGSEYYGIPFFKLYEQYQMIDSALLSNYNKIHSSFRGSGLITNGNEYFIFVDLHKEEEIKESINYKDKFINRTYFQWQTPNSTAQKSERGKNILFNKERKINLHIFVRKYKQIDGVVQPYIYLGKGDTVKYSGEKPITILFKLEKQVPANIYGEFTEKV